MLATARRTLPAVLLSLIRPGEMPLRAPMGRSARELPSDRWQDHPGVGLTAQRIVQIYREAECGYPRLQCDLFDDIVESDCHLRNLLDQRAQAVAGKPWVVQAAAAGADDELAARVLQAALADLPMIQVWKHQLAFNRYGWGASEIDWGIRRFEGRDWIVPVWFANVPPVRFRIDANDQLRLLTTDFATEGEPLLPGKWLVTRGDGGKLARQSLLRSATWMAYFKRNTTGDWFIYAQKYGLPITLVKVLNENDEESKAVGVEIVANVSEDGGALIPKDFEVQLVQAASADSAGTHGGLIAHANREMSKLINGATLANDNGDAGGASYALGDVHDSVRFECVLYDAEQVEEAFRVQVAAPFLRFNGLDARAPLLAFQLSRDVSPERRLSMADTLVNKLKQRISRAQLFADTSFREPLDDADAIGPAPEPTPAPMQEAA